LLYPLLSVLIRVIRVQNSLIHFFTACPVDSAAAWS